MIILRMKMKLKIIMKVIKIIKSSKEIIIIKDSIITNIMKVLVWMIMKLIKRMIMIEILEII